MKSLRSMSVKEKRRIDGTGNESFTEEGEI
jgi:hypothetical protein